MRPRYLAALCLLAVPFAARAGEPKKPETKIMSFDKDGDGKPDKWAVFVDGTVSEIGYDRNHDGNRDFWEFLNPNGRMARTESDRNYDGKPDLVVYYANGNLAFKMVDDNFDGTPDRIVYFDGDERVGLSSEQFDTIRSKPEAAMDPAARPGDKGPVGKAKAAAADRTGTARTGKTRTARAATGKNRAAVMAAPDVAPPPAPSAFVGPAGPAADGTGAGSAETASAAGDDQAFFPLGPDFLVRIPVPGGSSALSESHTWNVERERKLFRWTDDGTPFELQNMPTQGAVRVRYDLRDDPGERVGEEEFDRKSKAFARRTFGRLLNVIEQQRTVETAMGPARLATYAVKNGRQSQRISLCIVLAKDYWVYFMAVSPRDTHEALESALVEMLLGARIG